MTYDISLTADGESTVYVRWVMGGTDAAVTYPGWNIDDVQLWADPLEPEVPGDVNDDGHVNLSDFSTFAVCYAGPGHTTPPGGCTAEEFDECDLNQDGDVDLGDFSTFAVWFGT